MTSGLAICHTHLVGVQPHIQQDPYLGVLIRLPVRETVSTDFYAVYQAYRHGLRSLHLCECLDIRFPGDPLVGNDNTAVLKFPVSICFSRKSAVDTSRLKSSETATHDVSTSSLRRSPTAKESPSPVDNPNSRAAKFVDAFSRNEPPAPRQPLGSFF